MCWSPDNVHHSLSSPYCLKLCSVDCTGICIVWDVSVATVLCEFNVGSKSIMDLKWLQDNVRSKITNVANIMPLCRMLVEISSHCWFHQIHCLFGMWSVVQKLQSVHFMKQSHTWSLILLTLHFLSVSVIHYIVSGS